MTTPQTDAAASATVDRYVAAVTSRDPALATGCFAEDGVLTTPGGTFRGRIKIGPYIEWVFAGFKQMGVHERGIGRRFFDGGAVVEEMQTFVDQRDHHYELPTVTVFEFDGQGMILRMEVFQDGWAFVRQGADQSSGLSGLVARSFTSRIDSEMKKGMPV
jgi:hypothetical protein